MVRFVAKGGVWKNSEDEILKAAVMKYGKNQWARISSLLVRKTPKACKARWYEWLDPMIRKTEWTREEEEKLLHLAKLMPTQWRTIAPLVGRTATQCLEHYNKLLDSAAAASDDHRTAAAAIAEARKLRPGEVDPLPEAKPAKPDPIDMENDEIEMLSEARARLANTKGKKEKRKEREKMLDEARRVAGLQKQRELKAAGINIHMRKQVNGIDYNKEIPFQRIVPQGPFDTTAEDEEGRRTVMREEEIQKMIRDGGSIPVEMMEPMSKTEVEKMRRKEDVERQKRREEEDLPGVLLKQNREAEAKEMMMLRKKAKLNLPAPQITPTELEQIAHQSTSTSSVPSLVAMRTPARVDTVMVEAQNLARMTVAQTPLAGGVNPVLAEVKREAFKTPNVFVASNINSSNNGIKQPLNKRQKKDEFVSMLEAVLPAPKHGYQMSSKALGAVTSKIAQVEEEEKMMVEQQQQENARKEDVADAIAREERKRQQVEQELLSQCSESMRRGLPRALNPNCYRGDEQSVAEQLIAEELSKLILFELDNFPPKGYKGSSSSTTTENSKVVTAVTQSDIDSAARMIEAELASSTTGKEKAVEVDMDQFKQVWEECFGELIYVPSLLGWIGRSKATEQQVKESQEAHHKALKDRLKRETTKAEKAEHRAGVYCGGYETRFKQLRDGVVVLQEQASKAKMELVCFTSLANDREAVAAVQREKTLIKELHHQQEMETKLQQRYQQLLEQYQQQQTTK